MTYEEFKCGPPRWIMEALGPRFLDALEMATNYSMFRKLIVTLNDSVDRACFVKAALKYGRVCSAGERELLKGLLLLCNFGYVADKLAKGQAFTNMPRCGGDFRRALATSFSMPPISTYRNDAL